MAPRKRTQKTGCLSQQAKSKRGANLKIYQQERKRAKQCMVENIASSPTLNFMNETNDSINSITTFSSQCVENICTHTPLSNSHTAPKSTNQNSETTNIQEIIHIDECSNTIESERCSQGTEIQVNTDASIDLSMQNTNENTLSSIQNANVDTTLSTENANANAVPATETENKNTTVPNDHNYNASEKGKEPTLVFEYDEVADDKKLLEFEAKFKGSRVVDIAFYEEQVAQLNDHHSPTDCNFSNMILLHEKRNGIAFVRTFKCKMCNMQLKLYSHRYLKNVRNAPKTKEMNPNEAAVTSTMLAGVGQIVLDRILSSLNIPSISTATYAKYRSKVANNLHQVAIEDMRRAAEKAGNLARLRGDVTPDGIPMITVIIDGAWCRRCYRSGLYNSLGGCGVIIAAETGEVIYIAVKNKFCVICAKAQNKKTVPKKHTCFKNWPADKSSASMEAQAILEGFLSSLAMYGIIYHKIVADGDASCHKCILDADPYDGRVIVQKIECKNHLLRNFCTNIQAECNTSSGGIRELVALKKYVSSKLMQLRGGIVKAIEHRSKEGISRESAAALAKDIINAPSHVFGEHRRCAELQYFCDGTAKENEVNKVPELQERGLYKVLMERCNILASHSYSLLHNVTTNAVESFNAIIASKISGKRINFTGRDSYQARVYAAVSHHLDGEAFRKVHKKSVKASPAYFAKIQEGRVQRRRIKQRGRVKKRLNLDNSSKVQTDYGLNAAQPDMSPERYELAKASKLKSIKEQLSKPIQIELETREQRDSLRWRQLRKNLITASNMGNICRMRNSTSAAATVQAMLYSEFDNDAVGWGRQHESTAKKRVEAHMKLDIQDCGLYVHPDHFFIGASPDGIVGDDCIVEIKCPYSARKMTIRHGVENGKIGFLNENLELKTTNRYYYQVQCQLEVTNRAYCFFVVWTLRETLVITIKRDIQFWENSMFGRVKQFYFNCVLPELVDSRKKRGLPLRNINFEGKVIEKSKKNDKKAKKPTFEKKEKEKVEPQVVTLFTNVVPKNLSPESTPPSKINNKKRTKIKTTVLAKRLSKSMVQSKKKRIRKNIKDMDELAEPLPEFTPPPKRKKKNVNIKPDDLAESLPEFTPPPKRKKKNVNIKADDLAESMTNSSPQPSTSFPCTYSPQPSTSLQCTYSSDSDYE